MTQRAELACRLIVLGTLAAAPLAQAYDASSNVAFSAVHLSPWASGQAIDLSNSVNLVRGFNVNLPAINPDPVKALADFLGVPLPFDASVTIGAHADGSVGFDFGYAVTAGRLNITYPAIGTLSVPTIGTSNILTDPKFTLTSSFQPGLQQPFVPSKILDTIAGGGYAVMPFEGLSTTTFKDPKFTTSFPSFAAWADGFYDVNAGASINANLKFFGQCVVCVGKTLTMGDSRDFPIVEMNGAGLSVLGGPDIVPFSGTIPIVPGELSATINIPNLAVASAPLAPGSRTLTGSGEQSVIRLDVDFEKLVPFIGGLLSNSIGPFGYDLLQVVGGPDLSVYQNFSFTPDPQVLLFFSQTMLVQGSDGVYRPSNNAFFDLGNPVNIEVPIGTKGDVTFQPTYFLTNQFSNETGLSLSAFLNVSALAITTSFGDLGPINLAALTSDGLHIPLYDNTFSESLGSITPNPFTIDVGDQLLKHELTSGFDLVDVEAQADGRFDIRFKDRLGGFVDLLTDGHVSSSPQFCPPNVELCPHALQVLITDSDLFLNGVDIGNAFCIFCSETNGPLATQSPSVTDALGDVLYLTDLSEFPSGDCESNVGICDGTYAPTNRPFVPLDPTQTQIATASATVVITGVPEPGLPWLLALASALALAVERARRHDLSRNLSGGARVKRPYATAAGNRRAARTDARPHDAHSHADALQRSGGPAVRVRLGGRRLRLPFRLSRRIRRNEPRADERAVSNASMAALSAGRGLRLPRLLAGVSAPGGGPDR
jgi:hypothetical protein